LAKHSGAPYQPTSLDSSASRSEAINSGNPNGRCPSRAGAVAISSRLIPQSYCIAKTRLLKVVGTAG